MTSPARPDVLPKSMKEVLCFVSDASVAIDGLPLVAWVDDAGEWWAGLPQSYIRLSNFNWTVERWQPLPLATPASSEAAEGAGNICPHGKPFSILNPPSMWCPECGPAGVAAPPQPPAPDAMREALQSLENWCGTKRNELGAVEGHDFRSGEEYGLRCVEIEIKKRRFSAPVPSLDGAVKRLVVDAVIKEMIEVAASPDEGVHEEWTSENRATIDSWQCRIVKALSPSGARATESETDEEFEVRLLKQDSRDMLRLLDYIADKIGLPHNVELSQENFLAGFGAAEPVAWQWRKRGPGFEADGKDVWSDVDYNEAALIKQHPEKYEVRSLYAALPVRGDREIVRRAFAQHIRLVPVDRTTFDKYADEASFAGASLSWMVKSESIDAFLDALFSLPVQSGAVTMTSRLVKSAEEVDEVAPHYYNPSTTHMGDCKICGHEQDSVLHIDTPKHTAAGGTK